MQEGSHQVEAEVRRVLATTGWSQESVRNKDAASLRKTRNPGAGHAVQREDEEPSQGRLTRPRSRRAGCWMRL